MQKSISLGLSGNKSATEQEKTSRKQKRRLLGEQVIAEIQIDFKKTGVEIRFRIRLFLCFFVRPNGLPVRIAETVFSSQGNVFCVSFNCLRRYFTAFCFILLILCGRHGIYRYLSPWFIIR